MDALSLLNKFLREMSLGVLLAMLAALLAVSLPVLSAWNWVKVHIRR
jgi:hypothetical protein